MNELRRYRPYWAAYISVQEGWYHLIAVLIFVPTASYLLIGKAYLTDGWLFAKATALISLLYVPIAFILTVAIRYPIRRFPDVRQTTARVALMILVTSALTSIYATTAVWILSKTPFLAISFSPANIIVLISLGLIFDILFCLAHGYFYARSQWHAQQMEVEQLKKATIQRHLDLLKMQINPHFLFNSLNSLSSLISEDRQQAERFVDELAKVYRYLLQTSVSLPGLPESGNKHEFVSLSTELGFINSYAYLLKTRYGKGISVSIDVDLTNNTYYLPPQTLQILIENAVKHNIVLASKPLCIDISLTTSGQLMVRNNFQKRPVRIETNQAGLSSIVAKYRLLNKQEVTVQNTGTHFAVLIPLLSDQQLIMAS
ncbi:sensor histidine kinase [Tellurirhabdus bombi]|uniref:sensor histidine kinase n=1 Tax=Tellurirhabdus bombi TaxID=2907205 RepID=UPI001F2FC6E6|nr:histidine kinase [Tellurirhabdus bombi]